MSGKTTVEQVLARLIKLARHDANSPEHGRTFRLPKDLITPVASMLSVSRRVAAAMKKAEDALAADLRFEHVEDTDAVIRDLVACAVLGSDTDLISRFIADHQQTVISTTCFIPVEFLQVDSPTHLSEIRLLPLTHPDLPVSSIAWTSASNAVGCVAEVRVQGTDRAAMVQRARAQLDHALRVARVALRENPGIHDQQLRFRTGTAFAFSDTGMGWKARADRAYPLKVDDEFVKLASSSALWGLPLNPANDIQAKANLALTWMERARFAGDHLVSLLYLFFALEALLGDKSEGLKADGVAFRQLVLSHAVTGYFRHPNDTWFLYDRVRSYAVHGEEPPEVDDETVVKFEWAVRDTLNQFLAFASDNGITRRSRLVQALNSLPDVPQLVEWVEVNGGSDWTRYFDRLLGANRQA